TVVHWGTPVSGLVTASLPIAWCRFASSCQFVIRQRARQPEAGHRAHGRVSFMRKQYHLWAAATGFDAWDVGRLISLSRGLPVHAVPVASVREVDTVYWFDGS